MTALPHIKYFLGANAPSGFYSLYPELIQTKTAQAVYILKGGPGCGKSTLMRQVAQHLAPTGAEMEYILCSGDPDSLDALLLPGLKVALVDGTAPHVIEPKYPGVVERYLNLGECYDLPALAPKRAEIISAMAEYKEAYQRAYRCLAASGEIYEDVRSTLLTQQLTQRLAKRAGGILSREIRRKKGGAPGHVKQRFLGAVTHRGEICEFDTAQHQCHRIYELVDNYGLAHDLLIHLLAGAVAGGYDVVACPVPMFPDRMAHLLIPELGLAFLTSTKALPFPGSPYRRIRLDAAIDGDAFRRNRPRLRFSSKMSAALIDEGVESLAQAKERHDHLEQLYNPHVKFDLVAQMAQRVAQEIMSLPLADG